MRRKSAVEARAWESVQNAIARVSGRPPLRERLEKGGRLQGVGVVALSIPESAGSAAGPAIASARSDDLRLTATLEVTRFGEVWVGFEAEDPGLAGRLVRFALRAEGERTLMEGAARLEPSGPDRHKSRCQAGTLEGLDAGAGLILLFALA